MMFVIDDSNETHWLPIYCLNFNHTHSTSISIFIIVFELFFYILCAFATIITCNIFLNVRLFHRNTTFLSIILLMQWFEAVLAKILVIPHQVGMVVIKGVNGTKESWWTTNPEEMIHVPSANDILPIIVMGILLFHYVFSVFTGLLGLLIERCFAIYFLKDYENENRTYITISIFVFGNIFSILLTIFLWLNIIDYPTILIITTILFFLEGSLYLTIWYLNERLRRRLVNPGIIFTLSEKFQIRENSRHLKLASRSVLALCINIGSISALFFCLALNISPQISSFIVVIVESYVFLNPLIICPVIMFSSPVWKMKFLRSIPIVKGYYSAETVEVFGDKKTSETDVYFNNLKASWG